MVDEYGGGSTGMSTGGGGGPEEGMYRTMGQRANRNSLYMNQNDNTFNNRRSSAARETTPRRGDNPFGAAQGSPDKMLGVPGTQKRNRGLTLIGEMNLTKNNLPSPRNSIGTRKKPKDMNNQIEDYLKTAAIKKMDSGA